jgi:hypothetical protein
MEKAERESKWRKPGCHGVSCGTTSSQLRWGTLTGMAGLVPAIPVAGLNDESDIRSAARES